MSCALPHQNLVRGLAKGPARPENPTSFLVPWDVACGRWKICAWLRWQSTCRGPGKTTGIVSDVIVVLKAGYGCDPLTIRELCQVLTKCKGFWEDQLRRIMSG